GTGLGRQPRYLDLVAQARERCAHPALRPNALALHLHLRRRNAWPATVVVHIRAALRRVDQRPGGIHDERHGHRAQHRRAPDRSPQRMSGPVPLGRAFRGSAIWALVGVALGLCAWAATNAWGGSDASPDLERVLFTVTIALWPASLLMVGAT